MGLELMTYYDIPGPLTQLRKKFQDAGYREQERAITCALNRHGADPSELRASLRCDIQRPSVERLRSNKTLSRLGHSSKAAFKWIAFDLTCEYGFSSGRRLRIVGLLRLMFSIIYAVFMHLPGTSGIYLIGTRMVAGYNQYSRHTNPAERPPRFKMVEESVPLAAAGVARAARRHVLQPDVGLQHRLP